MITLDLRELIEGYIEELNQEDRVRRIQAALEKDAGANQGEASAKNLADASIRNFAPGQSSCGSPRTRARARH